MRTTRTATLGKIVAFDLNTAGAGLSFSATC